MIAIGHDDERAVRGVRAALFHGGASPGKPSAPATITTQCHHLVIKGEWTRRRLHAQRDKRGGAVGAQPRFRKGHPMTSRPTTALAVSAIFSACLAVTPIVAPGAAADEPTRLTAVLVYADWCASCQVLDPIVEAVKAGDAIDGVTMITLDYTDRDDGQFYEAADAAHVDEALESFMGERIKTGQLLLVDMDDERVVAKVTKDFSAEQITGALRAAAAVS